MNGMFFGLLVVLLLVASVGCDKSSSNNNNNRFCQPDQFNNCQNFGGIPGQPGFGNGNGIVGYGRDYNSGSDVYIELVGQSQFGGQGYISGQTYVYGQIDTNGFQCSNGGFIQRWILLFTISVPSYGSK